MKLNSIQLMSLGALFISISLLMFFLAPDPETAGIVPLERSSLIGILTAPLVHYEWQHLIENLGLLSFCFSVAIYGTEHSVRAGDFLIIYFLSGILTWSFGAYGLHIGASGVAIGFLFYLIMRGLFSFRMVPTASAGLLLLVYGVVVLDIWAPQPGVSIDYHISGALAGLGLALLRTDRFMQRVGVK
jgi:membrane associated rhomboid family serine protease